ncbi:MAG: sulfonate transport system substrate-binding protein [Acidimicrobiia bacterium]|nr:sulfonate transport system substrate-binding protein [Acidimicrobiia bacterium]
MTLRRPFTLLVALCAVAFVGAACGSSGGSSSSSTSTAGSAGSQAAQATTSSTGSATLRLGVFPNVTHATGLAGIEKGIFADKLGPNVKLQVQSFNAGPAAVEALFGDAIDATFVGPNPAINGYVKSKGDALRVIAGSTSGGAYLVVRNTIAAPADLKGKKLATPQLGNTQDVALRSWLKQKGLKADTHGGGDVSILPQENAQTLDAFKTGAIDGAWVPEPWATRLVTEAGAKVLVDERDLWPGGQYVTTQLIVAKKYLEKYPDVVKRLLEGQVAATDYVNQNQADAQKAANDQIEKLTGKRVGDALISASWKNLTFTVDPVATSLKSNADAAVSLGLLDLGNVDLAGIYDLKILNQVLAAQGKPQVKQL